MVILHQMASLVSSLSHSWREQVYYYLGAIVIYFLINTGAAYENALTVLVTPAGFAHLPGLHQAQGTPGCHVPATEMVGMLWLGDAAEQGRGEGIPAKGKE